MVRCRNGEDIGPPAVVPTSQDYELRISRARLVARLRRTWTPWDSQAKRDKNHQPNSSGWTLALVDYPLSPAIPKTVIKHCYALCLPNRPELERQNMLGPGSGLHPIPYSVYQPGFAAAEMAYRRAMVVDPNKRMTTSLRISSGGDSHQYREGGPYSRSRPKSWQTRKTLSALQLWKLVLNFEIALPPGEDAGLGRQVAGRPVGGVIVSSGEIFDSVQVWLAFAGQKATMSFHFSFLNPVNSYVALEITELIYEGDFEVVDGQMMETHLRIKLRPHVPSESTIPPLRVAAGSRPRRQKRRVKKRERLSRGSSTTAKGSRRRLLSSSAATEGGAEQGDEDRDDSDGPSSTASKKVIELD